jgi:hypothetical protein
MINKPALKLKYTHQRAKEKKTKEVSDILLRPLPKASIHLKLCLVLADSLRSKIRAFLFFHAFQYI